MADEQQRKHDGCRDRREIAAFVGTESGNLADDAGETLAEDHPIYLYMQKLDLLKRINA